MTVWDELKAELDLWAEQGRTVAFWWRDDDAIEPTAALDRLLDCAGETPLNLAVIPKFATPELADRLIALKNVTISQHGWQHVNHAAKGEKKAEFKGGRDQTHQYDDIVRGRDVLRNLFGNSFLSLFVPPWNRIDDQAASALVDAGFHLLSTFNARTGQETAPKRLNTHMDIIDWRGSRGYAGDDLVIGQAIRHLKAKRDRDGVDPTEPTGLLTHHLVHDAASTAFLVKFNRFILDHPGSRWIDARDELKRLEEQE